MRVKIQTCRESHNDRERFLCSLPTVCGTLPGDSWGSGIIACQLDFGVLDRMPLCLVRRFGPQREHKMSWEIYRHRSIDKWDQECSPFVLIVTAPPDNSAEHHERDDFVPQPKKEFLSLYFSSDWKHPKMICGLGWCDSFQTNLAQLLLLLLFARGICFSQLSMSSICRRCIQDTSPSILYFSAWAISEIFSYLDIQWHLRKCEGHGKLIRSHSSTGEL